MLFGVAGLLPWAPAGLDQVTGGPPGKVTYVFQDGLNGYAKTVDTHIRQSDPATPVGDFDLLVWDTDDPPPTGNNTYALLRFDDIIGNGAGRIPRPILTATARSGSSTSWHC